MMQRGASAAVTPRLWRTLGFCHVFELANSWNLGSSFPVTTILRRVARKPHQVQGNFLFQFETRPQRWNQCGIGSREHRHTLELRCRAERYDVSGIAGA